MTIVMSPTTNLLLAEMEPKQQAARPERISMVEGTQSAAILVNLSHTEHEDLLLCFFHFMKSPVATN